MQCSHNLLFWALFFWLWLPVPILGAEIKGPTEVTPGTPAVFTMVGLPAEHLDHFNWQVFAAPDDAMVLDLADRSGNPVLMFWTRSQARCAIIADVNIPPDQFELLVHEFSVGKPEPEPEPEPDPAEAVDVLLLYESDDVDDQPWLGNLTTSQKIRRLQSDTLGLTVADKDELDERDENTPAVKTWVEYARRHKLTLPRFFFLNRENGKLIASAAVPHTVDESVKLIGRYVP